MSCITTPSLNEFAQLYNRTSGFRSLAKAGDVEKLARAYSDGMMGHHGDEMHYETRSGKVTLYCPKSREQVIARWTTKQLAAEIIDPSVEQGALL